MLLLELNALLVPQLILQMEHHKVIAKRVVHLKDLQLKMETAFFVHLNLEQLVLLVMELVLVQLPKVKLGMPYWVDVFVIGNNIM